MTTEKMTTVEYPSGDFPQEWLVYDQQLFNNSPIPEGHGLAGQLQLQLNNLAHISGDFR